MKPPTLLALLLLAGCSSGGDVSTPATARPPIEVVAADAGPIATDDEGAGDCESTWNAKELAESTTAPFDAIDLQLDRTPSFIISQGLYGARTFTRMPTFTLYRDGTVFYPERGDYPHAYLTAKLARKDADDLKARVLALGAEQLKSHTSDCTCPTDSEHGKVMICTSDASYRILRFRDGKDVLHHVVVYSGYWNRPKIAEQVLGLLTKYRAPSEAPYIPDHATLVLERSENEPACTGSVPPAVVKVLTTAKGGYTAQAIDGADLRAVQAIVPDGRADWCNAKKPIRAYLYPWLPQMDHRPAITAYDTVTE